MQLRVTKIEKPGPDDGQGLPVVHFRGSAQSLDNSFDGEGNSNVRGVYLWFLARGLLTC